MEVVFENFTKGRSVLQNVIDGHVGDLVTDDGSSKVANFLGNHGRALPLQVISEALEEFSGSVTKLVRGPNEHARNSHTLHLQCNLFSRKVDLAELRGEGHNLVSGHNPG